MTRQNTVLKQHSKMYTHPKVPCMLDNKSAWDDNWSKQDVHSDIAILEAGHNQNRLGIRTDLRGLPKQLLCSSPWLMSLMY